jgi:hypothetical protein|tara:strand:+ start:184 stop:396 length:213 start_codon:yes stop_codon:yes gene_type:complete
MRLTSAVVAVDTDCLQRIVAELLVERLAFANACSVFARLLAEGASRVGHQVADCHKTGRSECHLGAVVRS